MFNQSPSAVPKIRTTIKCQLNVGKFLFSIFLLATDTFIQNLECYLCMNAQNEFQMFLYFLHFSKEQVNFEKKVYYYLLSLNSPVIVIIGTL
jgi:hypothetical protein